MSLTLAPPLADRTKWRADACSIGKAMEVVGTRSAMLLLREAFYGTTRFDDFVTRVGITEAVAAGRLKALVELGLFDKQPYRDPGRRTRQEYVLTEMGRDLLPAVLALMQWGDQHLQGGRGPVRVVEEATGSEVHVRICGPDGDPVSDGALRLEPSAPTVRTDARRSARARQRRRAPS
jgi:DNA-binding HxlR family transcriptional regulator